MTRSKTMPRASAVHTCKALTKAGALCTAPAVEHGLCYFHAHPERLPELGRQGGRKNQRYVDTVEPVPDLRLCTVADVRELLAETINGVRARSIDPKAANSISILAATMLKALQQGDIEARLQALEAVLSETRS